MMGIYWEHDAEDGTGRNSETGNGKDKEIYGCGERGHGSGLSDEGGCRRYDQIRCTWRVGDP